MDKAIVQAILGNHSSALEMLSDSKDFSTCIVKAQLLINLGKSQDAISVLD